MCISNIVIYFYLCKDNSFKCSIYFLILFYSKPLRKPKHPQPDTISAKLPGVSIIYSSEKLYTTILIVLFMQTTG